MSRLNLEPIRVQLVTTIGCNRCLAAKRALSDLLERVQDEYRLEVRELDLLDHPEVAAEHGIWSTPALIINDNVVLVGTVEEGALRARLAEATDGPRKAQWTSR